MRWNWPAPASAPPALRLRHPRHGRHQLDNPEQLAEVLEDHDLVIGLACGHVHRSVFTRWAGLPACICPSPAHQIHLDTNENAPLSWTLEAGGFLLHRVKDGVLTTHVVNRLAPLATSYA